MRGDSMSIRQSNSPRSSDSNDETSSIHASQSRSSRKQFRDRSPVPSPEIYSGGYSRPLRGESTSYQRERDESPFRSSSPPLPPPNRIFHPYAHPEVVASSESLVHGPMAPRISHGRLSDDQQPNVSVRRSSESNTSSLHNTQSAIRKGSAPELPSRKVHSRSKMAPHEEEGQLTKTFPVPLSSAWPGPAPFSDYSSTPMSNLISLEEARARVQQKQTNAAVSTPPKSTPAVPASFASPPSTDGSGSTPRHRTTSTGKRSTGGGDEDPITAPKALKHKRSAFMKLFAGKEKEGLPKDRDSPTLSISDPIIRATSTPPRVTKADTSGDIPPVPSLHNIKRIPPPSLSIVVSSPSVPHSDLDGQDSVIIPPSPSRTINLPSDNSSQYLSSKLDAPHSRTNSGIRPPASAPPSQTRFEGLSLRPVSTIFSAKFSDILGEFVSPPADLGSFPSSSSNSSTPNVGPSPTHSTFETSRTNSMSTASDYPLTPATTHGISSIPALSSPSSMVSSENPNTVIISLQTEMANLRKIHQRQVWELEGQIKDLKEEMEQLRNTGDCEACGKEKKDRRTTMTSTKSRPKAVVSVVDRPRPKAARPSAERTVFGGGIE